MRTRSAFVFLFCGPYLFSVVGRHRTKDPLGVAGGKGTALDVDHFAIAKREFEEETGQTLRLERKHFAELVHQTKHYDMRFYVIELSLSQMADYEAREVADADECGAMWILWKPHIADYRRHLQSVLYAPTP